MKRLFSLIGVPAAVLMLIYTIYYVAMRSTGGILRPLDLAVCLPVGVLCIAVIVHGLYEKWKNRP